MIKSIEDIRFDLGQAAQWLEEARFTLDLGCAVTTDINVVKADVQEAKKLIDEAIVDLDGLLQDQKDADATR
jgi:hypothetical protein